MDRKVVCFLTSFEDTWFSNTNTLGVTAKSVALYYFRTDYIIPAISLTFANTTAMKKSRIAKLIVIAISFFREEGSLNDLIEKIAPTKPVLNCKIKST